MAPLKLGTRASPLALAQTDQVIAALAKVGIAAQAHTFSTRGDRDLSKPLHELGDKGLFTQELEAALMSGEIDAAVHSAKDMSALDDLDLPIVAALERDSRADVLISNRALDDLPEGARIGTSSLRRAAQLKSVRPDLLAVPVRGNVQTRLKKWQEGEVDALILAAAGLRRMDLVASLPTHELDWDTAPAQGLIAIQARSENDPWKDISHEASYRVLHIERALVRGLGAHCRLPVSCHVSDGLAVRLSAWAKDGSAKHATGQIDQETNLAAQVRAAEDLGQGLKAELPTTYWDA